jgi:uncharacterized protein YdaU (DUF1376 family)
MSSSFMPLYVGDYLSDTAHLTAEEHGAYLLLIMAYWQAGRSLPNDPKRLALIARVPNERWTDVERTLQQFFNVTPTEWQHERIEAELERYRDKVEKAKKAGKASARKRKATDVPTDAQRPHQQTPNYPDPSSYPKEKNTISSEPSTPRESCAAPKVDLDRLVKACNGALDNPANCMGLLTSATPIMWLESGCDLDRDVLPTLEAAGKKHHGKRIRSWDYFTGAITEARDRRLRGLPPLAARKPDREPAPIYTLPTRQRERTEDELMAIAIEQLRADGIAV